MKNYGFIRPGRSKYVLVLCRKAICKDEWKEFTWQLLGLNKASDKLRKENTYRALEGKHVNNKGLIVV